MTPLSQIRAGNPIPRANLTPEQSHELLVRKGWYRKSGRWQASIQINNKPKYLGLFGTAEQASAAYATAAREAFGEFARIA